MAGCGDEVCYFELPASLALPARIQEVFPGATPTGWTLSAGSRFGIVARWREPGAAPGGNAESRPRTPRRSMRRTGRNQSIQADIKPIAFNGSDRWFGLATRWSNSSNYYYVSVRNSGSVSLRRNVNGVFARSPRHRWP